MLGGASRRPLSASPVEWPARRPHIPPQPKLRRTIRELARLGYFAIEDRGGEALVSYGPRTRELAEKWGITLSETKEAVTG